MVLKARFLLWQIAEKGDLDYQIYITDAAGKVLTVETVEVYDDVVEIKVKEEK